MSELEANQYDQNADLAEKKQNLLCIKQLLPKIESALHQSKFDEAHKLAIKLPKTLIGDLKLDCAIALLMNLAQAEDLATKYIIKILQANPGNEEALSLLYNIFNNKGRVDELIPVIEKALKIKPSAKLFFLLGNYYHIKGHWQVAKLCFESAQKLDPFSAAYKISTRLTLLNLFEDYAQEEIQLAKLMRELEDLCEQTQENQKLETCVIMLSSPVFNIAYHYVNHRPYLEKLSEVTRKVQPICNYISPHIKNWRPKKNNEKTRIVIVSLFLNKKDHSVHKIYHQIFDNLDPNKFEIISVHPKLDPSVFKPIKNAKHVHLHMDFMVDSKKITALKPDIVIYTDIGMDVLTYSMAHMRLAPIQCVMTGHPITTGINSLDYYISGKLLSPPEADELHTEKIIRLNCLPSLYKKPNFTPLNINASSYNLPLGKNIYYCPGLAFKVHPRMDSALKRILEADPDGIVVLSSSPLPDVNSALRNRLYNHLEESIVARIFVLPFMEANLYYNMLKLANVVLDTYHFGGGNTNFQCAGLGIPVVTMVDKFIPSRAGYAIYKTLGEFPELIAYNEDEYVAKALAVAKDRQLYNELSSRILNNIEKITADMQIVKEHERFFYEIARLPKGSSWV
jgi:protein O-GlcNAc transferase